jgi:methylthioribulose-1-phosphate dehydratase
MDVSSNSNSEDYNIPDDLVISNDNDPSHPAILIPELCKLFYNLGWVTGTG